MPSKPLASNGKSGRISGLPGIDAHLDTIVRIQRSHEWRRTETATERGAPLTVHRQRVPETATLEIVASDVEPFSGALLFGLWELNHASKTKKRLEQVQGSPTECRVWTGTEFLRTPAGIQVWVLDRIEYAEENTEKGVLRATLTFGENPRFATLFTAVLPDAAAELTDVVGNAAERGRQSTTTAGADAGAEVAAGAWP